MLALGWVVSFWLLHVCLVGAMCWLCSFYIFPAIDANNSGEEEEVVRTRILFILLEFLFDGVEEVQGQISQPRQAIFWSLAIYPYCCVHCSILYLVPCILCYVWSSTRCILTLKYVNPLLMLCMLNLSMYAPLTTYNIISLLVWWLTSWPLLYRSTYVDTMRAYPKHVWFPSFDTSFTLSLVVWWLTSCPLLIKFTTIKP